MISDFSKVLLLIVISVIGYFLLLDIPLQLNPINDYPSLTITTGWANSEPNIVEEVITRKIESQVLTLEGVKKIYSQSKVTGSEVRVEIFDDVNINMFRFELATKLRQVIKTWPREISYPQIEMNQPNEDSQNGSILTYSFYGGENKEKIFKFLQNQLIPKLSLISGLYKIETSGDEKKEHHIIYDKDKMISLGIDVLKIESALQPYLKKESIGKIQLGTHQYLATSVISKSNFDFNSIIVGKTNDRLITLGEIAQVVNESDPVQNILRINGTENVRLTFFPEKNANHITVANAIQKIINETNWPRGVQPLKQVDTTEFINNELIKIKTRFLATFILLFIFIYIAYRDFKTLLISLSALIINFGIALLAYKVL